MVNILNYTPYPESLIGMQVHFQGFIILSLDGSKCSAPSSADYFPT